MYNEWNSLHWLRLAPPERAAVIVCSESVRVGCAGCFVSLLLCEGRKEGRKAFSRTSYLIPEISHVPGITQQSATSSTRYSSTGMLLARFYITDSSSNCGSLFSQVHSTTGDNTQQSSWVEVARER